MSISPKDREYLRNLAKKQLEYASTAENKEREAKWYAHNDLKINDPRVTMEIEGNFYKEVARPLVCETEAARQIEEKLLILSFITSFSQKGAAWQYTIFCETVN